MNYIPLFVALGLGIGWAFFEIGRRTEAISARKEQCEIRAREAAREERRRIDRMERDIQAHEFRLDAIEHVGSSK